MRGLEKPDRDVEDYNCRRGTFSLGSEMYFERHLELLREHMKRVSGKNKPKGFDLKHIGLWYS